MAQNCPTSALDDAPAAEDVFGSHEPIVDAVHELITTEPGGRTVGLEGSWGSGKSTVVKLLAARMEGPNAHMVVFDTWAHEGDPLRRSFLEELIRSLVRKSWVNEASWSERREELAKRRRVERTRPVAKLEKPAIVAAAAAAAFAIFLPAGTTLIGAGLTADPISGGMVGGGSAILALLLVVIGAIAGLALMGRVGSARGAWLSLFSIQSVTESDRETIETPDPTSIEFESTFKDLMRSALGGSPGRRLVLVVDNLDRVAPEDARSIWATLQTFLHHSHDDREHWLDSLWVVLPYDPTGIARLWNGAHDDRSGAEAPSNVLAESFIEKSIQVRFEVPLPLITDWREYLESNLRVALPEHEGEFYTAYRLYAHKLAEDGRAPTPRELKQYVNRIGALHRRWQHTLPFSSLAYHACLNLSGVEVAGLLRNGKLPKYGFGRLLGEDVEGDLAALAFNTERRRAQQLLLGPLIERALTLDTSDELVDLLARSGFWETLLELPTLQGRAALPDLLTATNRLAEIPQERRADAEWREVRLLLAESGRSLIGWPPLSKASASELFGLLSLVDEASAISVAASATELGVEPDHWEDWAEGAYTLLSQFDWLTVRASRSPEAVYAVLARVGADPSMTAVASRLAIEPSDRAALDQLILAGIETEPDKAKGALGTLDVIEANLDWHPFVSAAGERLRSSSASHQGSDSFRITADQSRSLLELIRLAGATSSEERAALTNEGMTLEYVALASREGDEDALGDWLYEELRQFPSEFYRSRSDRSQSTVEGQLLVRRLLSDQQHQAVVPLAAAIERQGGFELIGSLGANPEGQTLASALVNELWESERFRAAMSGEVFVKLWPHISGAAASSEHDLEEFISAVGGRPEFAAELVSGEFAAAQMGMYAEVIRLHAEQVEATRLAGSVVTVLAAQTLEQWLATMADSDDWVDLLRVVRDVNPEARIGGTFALALVRVIDRVAGGVEVGDSVSAHWADTVVPSVAPTTLEAYRVGVVAAAGRVEGQLPGAFFELAGRTLGEPATFARVEVLNGVLPNLIAARNGPGISWLIETLKEGDKHRKLPEGGLDVLVEVVRASLQQPTDVREQLLEIAELIGVQSNAESNVPAQDERSRS